MAFEERGTALAAVQVGCLAHRVQHGSIHPVTVVEIWDCTSRLKSSVLRTTL
jgi:hypothetical protein